jgi:VanZ family protein
MKASTRRFTQFFLPAILYAAGIFALSSIPALSPPPVGFEFSDKLYHFVEFFGFGLVLIRAFANSGSALLSSRPFAAAVIVGIFYALTDEFHQYFVPNREVELWDVVADALGVVAISFAWWLWKRKRRSHGN